MTAHQSTGVLVIERFTQDGWDWPNPNPAPEERAMDAVLEEHIAFLEDFRAALRRDREPPRIDHHPV